MVPISYFICRIRILKVMVSVLFMGNIMSSLLSMASTRIDFKKLFMNEDSVFKI